PLAFTKTFALIASVVVALTIIPPVAHVLLGSRFRTARLKQAAMITLVIAGVLVGISVSGLVAVIFIAVGLFYLAERRLPRRVVDAGPTLATALVALVVTIFLAQHWLPLGPQPGLVRNLIFVVVVVGGL